MLNFKLEGEAREQYTIVRDYNYGSGLNVYKTHKKNDPETHYVIKSYKTKEDFERESQMLRELHDAKNIVQMIDAYPLQLIIDVVSGLSELQKHNIVHTELAPKNIMYFQEKDGYTETDFAMDMFSFGLILYLLETGHDYWDGENEKKREEIISTKYLPLRNIGDPTACYVIKSLLDKKISHRMSLEGLIQTSYYISESSKQKSKKKEPVNTNNNKFESDDEINEERFQIKLTQEIQESYHNEIFIILNKNIMLDSISCQNSISPSSGIYVSDSFEDSSENFFVTKKWNYNEFYKKTRLYNRFLWLIVRYYAVKDCNSLATKMSNLYHNIIEINSMENH
ncbi:unnamed protein product [Rhizophagus irregularis]|nr:unnamed protein product [Rhizophagus irregularis]